MLAWGVLQVESRASQRLQHPLIKVYSLIKGYWSLWVQASFARPTSFGSFHQSPRPKSSRNSGLWRLPTEDTSNGSFTCSLCSLLCPSYAISSMKHEGGNPKPLKPWGFSPGPCFWLCFSCFHPSLRATSRDPAPEAEESRRPLGLITGGLGRGPMQSGLRGAGD